MNSIVKFNPSLKLSAFLLSSLLLATPCVHAATLYWDSNALGASQTDGLGAWLDANQWWDGLTNVSWTSGDDAVFGNGGAGGAVTLASPTTVNSLTFNAFTGTYTLGTAGQAITLNNGITVNSGAGIVNISSPITFGAAQTWTNNSSSLLTIGTGAITNSGFLLTVGGTGNTTISGAISGSGGLTKNGAGTLTLSAASSYTGAVTINAGTLNVSGAGATPLGSSSSSISFTGDSTLAVPTSGITNVALSAINISNGVTATIDAGNGGTGTNITAPTISGSGNLFISSNGGAGKNITTDLSAFTGVLQYTNAGGPVNVRFTVNATGLSDAVASNIRVASNVASPTDGFVFSYAGTGSLTLNNRAFEIAGAAGNRLTVNNNSSAGNFVINTNLAITTASSKLFILGGTNTSSGNAFAGTINDGSSGNVALTKTGIGSWALTNASNGFTGAITMSSTSTAAGTLAYASAGGANTITFSQTTGSATLSYIGSTDKTMSGAITASALTSGTITFDSSGAGAVNYSNTASLGAAASGNKNLILSGSNSGTNTLAGGWNNNTGGAATITKNGNGNWVLSGTNNYSGKTTVNAGTLQFTKMVSLNNDVDSNWTAAKINVKSAATLAFNVDSAGTNGFTDAKLNTLIGNISVANTATEGLQAGAILGFDTSTATGGTFTQGNAIANSTGSGSFHGAIGLTKLGTGTLILDKANTYTGATTVGAGKLAVNGSITSAVTVQTGATLQGSGTISNSVTISTGGTLATGNSIESLATGTLTLAAAATLAYEIDNDAAAGVAGDLTAVTGNLNLDLGNASILTLTELGSGSWTVGESLTLISYNGTWNGGLFTYNSSTLNDGATFSFSGMDWVFDYNDATAGSNYTGDLVGTNFVTMTAIPEPKVVLLGAMGILLLLRRRR